MEAGLFFLLIGVGFLFTVVNYPKDRGITAGFRIMASAIFAGLSIFIISGFEVAETVDQTIKNLNDSSTWQETDHYHVLSGGTDSAWFGYVTFTLCLLNFFFAVKGFIPEKNKGDNSQ